VELYVHTCIYIYIYIFSTGIFICKLPLYLAKVSESECPKLNPVGFKNF
jgi:hypothetical protein